MVNSPVGVRRLRAWMTSLAFVLIGLHAFYAQPAAAVPMFTVTPERLVTQIIENHAGAVKFTVENTGSTDLTITAIRLVNNSSADSIEFVKGDLFDRVKSVAIGSNKNCLAHPLAPESTCAFVELVFTIDEDIPLSDEDKGRWLIFNIVQAGDQLVGGAAFVDVRDCTIKDSEQLAETSSPQECPEPSSLMLFGAGIVSAGLARRRLSRHYEKS